MVEKGSVKLATYIPAECAQHCASARSDNVMHVCCVCLSAGSSITPLFLSQRVSTLRFDLQETKGGGKCHSGRRQRLPGNDGALAINDNAVTGQREHHNASPP